MKVAIIITEGVEKSLLDHQISSGRLPWFSRVKAESGYWPMDCGPVPYEPVNLATAFSGVGPGHHGCFSYWAIEASDDFPRILEAADVRAKRFWEWEQFRGLTFCVVNVQLTHPPSPICGRLISYPMGATLRASFPHNLLRDLSRSGVRYAHDATVFYVGQPLEEFAAEAWRAAEYQLTAALALDDAEEADVFILNMTVADRLSHFLWHEIEQGRPDGGRPEILKSYDFIDRACAEIARRASQAVMVFSEIGFGGIDGFVSVDRYLQKVGLQALDEDGRVDRHRSLAQEAVQGSHGVILLDDQAEDEVRNALTAFRFDDGSPVFAGVARREEIYSGPWTELAPHFVLDPADARRPPLGDARWAEHVRRRDQSGWHRRSGFLALAGVEAPLSASDVRLEAIAPTIARLCGREPPPDLDAAPLIA